MDQNTVARLPRAVLSRISSSKGFRTLLTLACGFSLQVLEGDRLVNTPYDVSFRVDKESEHLCSRELSKKDLDKFRTAVKEDYYFQVTHMKLAVIQEEKISEF